MSIGYMPKKLKNARRQKRMRKKYKNFSCATCSKKFRCRRKIGYTSIGIIVVKGDFEFCPDWSAADEAKKGLQVTTYNDKHKNKRTFKMVLKDILK